MCSVGRGVLGHLLHGTSSAVQLIAYLSVRLIVSVIVFVARTVLSCNLRVSSTNSSLSRHYRLCPDHPGLIFIAVFILIMTEGKQLASSSTPFTHCKYDYCNSLYCNLPNYQTCEPKVDEIQTIYHRYMDVVWV